MNLWDMQTEVRRCAWCDDVIAPDDELAPPSNVVMHWECGLRAVVGGLNHLTGKCSCCGGTADPDPEGMTRREAARAAAKHWLLTYRIPQ